MPPRLAATRAAMASPMRVATWPATAAMSGVRADGWVAAAWACTSNLGTAKAAAWAGRTAAVAWACGTAADRSRAAKLDTASAALRAAAARLVRLISGSANVPPLGIPLRPHLVLHGRDVLGRQPQLPGQPV